MTAGRLLRRWVALRNRLLSNPAFQKWAADFPLTRRVAHRRAQDLFDIVAGFVYSQILAACVELKLLPFLAVCPRSVAEVVGETGLDPAGADRLLKGAAALGLAQCLSDGDYALGAEGAALLGNRGVIAMIEHHRLLYADLADPVALLRRPGQGGALAGYWSYALADDPAASTADGVAPYSALMAASQPLVAQPLLDAYSLKRHRVLLDVGGGEGAFVTAVADRWPHLDLMLFDLPAVAERAAARLGGRVAVTGGSVFADPLPRGADVVTLVRVLHDHDDDAALAILRAVHAALPPGGTLLIAEPMAGTRGAEAMGDGYFGFYLLAMGSGRPRTAREIGELLRRAGFVHAKPRRTRMPMTASLIVAQA
jgi:demethylspheroidene O-methyltransferase